MGFSQMELFVIKEQERPSMLRLSDKMDGWKVSLALQEEAMPMRDFVSTSHQVFLGNSEKQERFRNQIFHFGLFSKVILREILVVLEK